MIHVNWVEGLSLRCKAEVCKVWARTRHVVGIDVRLFSVHFQLELRSDGQREKSESDGFSNTL